MNKYTMNELKRKAIAALEARETKDDYRFNYLVHGIAELTGMHPLAVEKRIERLAKGDRDAA